MSTIAQKLEQLAEIKEDIRQAINDKGVEVTTAEPFTAYADKIAEIPQGGDERVDAPLLDVNFYDYDGWRCYSYSKEDFLALTAMPEQPQNEGFIGQGWNWTLEQAQAHVRKYRYLEVGAYCATADGKTRLYISNPSDGWECTLYVTSTNNSGVTIDWGDGTTSKPTTIGTTHTFAKGDYIITISTAEGTTIQLGNNFSQCNVIGNWYTGTNPYTPQMALRKLEIGASCVGFLNYAISNCYRLSGFNTPLGFNIASGHNNLGTIKFLLISVGMSFSSVSVKNISISPSYQGGVTWPSLYALKRAVFPEGVTAFGGNGMSGTFQCDHYVIPEGVTSINAYCFASYKVEEVVIPSTVTSIGASGFSGCVSLSKVVMKPTTPPTIQANTWRAVPFLTFYVPHGCLEAYQTATNWATYASRMVEMDE